MDNNSEEFRRLIITTVRDLCYKNAKKAYEEASFSGLCHEGAVDYMLDAIRSMDVDKILKQIPSSE